MYTLRLTLWSCQDINPTCQSKSIKCVRLCASHAVCTVANPTLSNFYPGEELCGGRKLVGRRSEVCIVHYSCEGLSGRELGVWEGLWSLLSSPQSNPLGLTSLLCYQNSLPVGTSCCSFLDIDHNKDLNKRTISGVNHCSVKFFVPCHKYWEREKDCFFKDMFRRSQFRRTELPGQDNIYTRKQTIFGSSVSKMVVCATIVFCNK